MHLQRSETSLSPDYTVTLMRYHGFTTPGRDIMSVGQSGDTYTRMNAAVQTTSSIQQDTCGGGTVKTLVDLGEKHPKVLYDCRGR